MTRLVLALALVAVAVGVALVLRRRRPAPPTQASWDVPAQLDRADFADPGKPWLVVVFSSSTCESCGRATAKAEVLASREVAYHDVTYQDRKDLHARYRVEVVPLTLVADRDGVVHRHFIGAPSAADLWAAVAEVRQPGATPEPDLGSGSGKPPPDARP